MSSVRPPGIGPRTTAAQTSSARPQLSLPGVILRSWRRCQHRGLDRETPEPVAPVGLRRLRQMRESNEVLWRFARAELETMAADAAVAGSIVVLTDAEGWILDAEGSPGFLEKAERVALTPGACWSERRAGTNAIGTAIHEGRAVQVNGAEHFVESRQVISCSAAPIFDPRGGLAGILDISGQAATPNLHALGLVKLAVAHIEHRYFDDGIEGCRLLRIQRDPALLGTAREGLLAFDDDRLVAANQAGLELLGLSRSDLGRIGYPALFDEPMQRLQDDGVLLDSQGRALYGRIDESRRSRPSLATRTPIRVAASARQDGHEPAPLVDEDLEADLERARRVLDAGIPVVVQGETGSGKEVFARELHRRSARADKPFVAVNCAALPEGLIEAELFGYEEGAFTGARKSGSPGLLRRADGGVLFLDEIGDMPLALQPRLLRVLQDQELSPLGGGKPVRLDFALVCASHRDLEDAVRDGSFRADLYYRISHHRVGLPPLRDSPGLRDRIRALWARLGGGRRLTAAAETALAGYAWPGNLRQLVSCLRTVAALSDAGAVVDVDMLPAYLYEAMQPAPPPAEREAASAAGAAATDLDAVTEAVMRDAVSACNGNISCAARRLGVSRSTLYRRLGNRGEAPAPIAH